MDAQLYSKRLEDLRQKLLDLTFRNVLLNTRLSTKKTLVRFVDEMPDQIFSVIQEGNAMSFTGLPLMEGDNLPDEETIEFTRAVTEAKISDPKFIDEISKLDEDDEKFEERYEESLRELKDQLRLEKGMPPRPKTQDSKNWSAWAKIHNINPSYDLPKAEDVTYSNPKYQDHKIQLLFPQDAMVDRLNKIYKEIDDFAADRGIRTATICYGFLEYNNDPREKNKRYLAPLMLMKVNTWKEISSDPNDHGYKFYVNSDEGVATSNFALNEKLKLSYNTVLPDLEEGVLPEDYWATVEEKLEVSARGWKVRRIVTFGSMIFSGIENYIDLNIPENQITNYEHLSYILSGVTPEWDPPVNFSKQEIDNLDFELSYPEPILPCDSSQHAAIADVLNGKNLILQGPPGSGKSQTITNMMAALIAQGKSVLFVAEKNAALQVVENRLGSLGFNPLCLNLHAMKQKQSDVFDSLRASLEMTYNISADTDELKRKRDDLRLTNNQFYDLMSKDYGSTGESISHVLRSASAIMTIHKPLDLDLGDPKRITENSISLMCSILSELFELYQDLKGFSKDHDIQLIKQTVSTPYIEEKVLELVNSVIPNIDFLKDIPFKTYNELEDNEIGASFLLENRSLDGLDISSLDCWDTQSLSDLCQSIRSFETKVKNIPYEDFYNNIELFRTVSPFLDDESINGDSRENDLKSNLLKINKAIQDFTEHLQGFSSSKVSVSEVKNLIEAIENFLKSKWKFSKEFTSPDILDLIDRYEQDLKNIEKAEKECNGRFKLCSMNPKIIKNAIKEVENDSFFKSLFSSKLRKAKKFIKNNILINPKEYKSIMDSEYELYAEFCDADYDFKENKRYKNLTEDLSASVQKIRNSFDEFQTIFQQLSSNTLLKSYLNDPESIWSIDKLASKISIHKECLEFIKSNGYHHTFEIVTQEMQDHINTLSDWNQWYSSNQQDLYSMSKTDFENLLDPIEIIYESISKINDPILKFFSNRNDEKEFLRSIELLSNFELQAKLSIKDIESHLTKIKECMSNLSTIYGVHENISKELSWNIDLKTIEIPNALNFISSINDYSSSIISKIRLNSVVENHKGSPILKFFRKYNEEIGVTDLQDMINVLRSSIIKNKSIDIYKSHSQVLTTLNGKKIESSTKDFADLDKKIQNKEILKVINAAIDERDRAPEGINSLRVKDKTEMSLIKHVLPQKRPRIKVRQLMQSSSQSITHIKPCVLMSPYSVPAYLDKDHVRFDVLIIDEASQMRVETAISPMLRANQIVVVGDSKQLPPTTFAKTKITNEYEDSEEMIDEESILDRCESVYKNCKRMLRWHYRSQDSSLIAFSNKWFYENKLMIFPTAVEGDSKYGIDATYLENASYKSSINAVEAREVVDYALWHFENRPKDSLVICTINLKQMSYVHEMLQSEIPTNEHAKKYIKKWEEEGSGVERFIVKNLENIQGDERDVVVISTVYGPETAGGRVLKTFGPINNPGGHRRLNVLFTRAKKLIKLYTSLKPSDVCSDTSGSEGQRALRGYLEYAFSKNLETTTMAPNKKQSDSPFEDQIIAMVESMGCEAVPQVGVSGYYIDIGVKHPDYKYGYLLGIECDGAAFHSSLTARERDRLREEILKSKGWDIYRIWSTDWWYHPIEERKRLEEYIKNKIQKVH